MWPFCFTGATVVVVEVNGWEIYGFSGGGVWKIGEKWIKRWRGEKGFRFKPLGCVLYFCVLLLVHTFFYSYIGPCWDVSPSTHWPSPVPGIGDFKKLLWNMGILCHLLGQIIAWKKSRLVKYENLARSIQLPLKKSRKKLGFSNPLLQIAIVGKWSFSFGSRVWKYHDPWWWGASILGRGNSHPKYMKIHGSTFSTTLCDWGWIHGLVGLSDYILHIYNNFQPALVDSISIYFFRLNIILFNPL